MKNKILVLVLVTVLFTACEPKLSKYEVTDNVIAANGSSENSDLVGTQWKLAKIAYSDDKVHVPEDPTRYTLNFLNADRFSVRLDCNRGNGEWNSPEPGLISLGLMASTRALCPPESLHDLLLRDIPNFRSYIIKDGNLYLALFADGGIYEFQPFEGEE